MRREPEKSNVRMTQGRDGIALGLEQVAEIFRLTPERIRQIEEEAIRKIWRDQVGRRRRG